jgi:beta-glucanase (GH16 family)
MHCVQWPYTYDACDVGTLPNQTLHGLPQAATVGGDKGQNGILSFLPGQRLSRCSCPDSSHPGPMHSDGSYVGRSAPEIDVFEAQITGTPLTGQVSQSGQWGPFNAAYQWFNTTENLIIPNTSATFLNEYMGGVFQQATSGVTETSMFNDLLCKDRDSLIFADQECYERTGGCSEIYGFEYKPGFDGAVSFPSFTRPGSLQLTMYISISLGYPLVSQPGP